MKDVENFLITGCARSGSGYIAKVLSELGVQTQHEAVFSPYADGFTGWGDVPGESSWLAAPFIDQLPAGTVVLHQVRHPDDVIKSLMGLRFFSQDATPSRRDLRSMWQVARARGVAGLVRRLSTADGRARAKRRRSDFVEFALRHCPEIGEADGEAARSAVYWSRWNRMVEDRATGSDVKYLRYRVEDLDAPLVEELVELVGVDVTTDQVRRAVEAVPSNFNTRPPATTTEPVAHVGSLDEQAERYGYDLSSAGGRP